MANATSQRFWIPSSFKFYDEKNEIVSLAQVIDIEYVDHPTDKYVRNDESTVVFAIKGKRFDADQLLKVMDIVSLARPDEFSVYNVGGQKVIRAWWD